MGVSGGLLFSFFFIYVSSPKKPGLCIQSFFIKEQIYKNKTLGFEKKNKNKQRKKQRLLSRRT